MRNEQRQCSRILNLLLPPTILASMHTSKSFDGLGVSNGSISMAEFEVRGGGAQPIPESQKCLSGRTCRSHHMHDALARQVLPLKTFFPRCVFVVVVVLVCVVRTSLH